MVVATTSPRRDGTSELPAAELQPGAPVEVRNRFDGRWGGGFEVTAVSDRGYRIRRTSDGQELPTEFPSDQVRPRRSRRRDMWWY
jgi:hypothetical protein